MEVIQNTPAGEEMCSNWYFWEGYLKIRKIICDNLNKIYRFFSFLTKKKI